MLTAERKTRIAEWLARDGRVIAADLSAQFGVSEDTIRRDLREMASEGLLKRVYGGAVPRSPSVPSFAGREEQSPRAKVAIGQLAAEQLRDGQVVILDSGTTPLEVARHLPAERRLTVVTHSLPVASTLAAHPNVNVIMLGGRLLKESLSMVGATTIAGYAQVRADVCVLGVVSVHPELGLGVFDFEDAEVKRAIRAASAETIVVASSEKLGTAAPFIVGPIAGITRLITDASAPLSNADAYRKLGIDVLNAPL